MATPAPPIIVPFFAGQGTTAVNSFQLLEHARRDASSSSGSILLTACHEAFHVELASLSPEELEQTQIVAADFKTRDTLLAIPRGHYSRNPIISGTRLFLLQSLRYLAFAESSRPPAEHYAPLHDILKKNAEFGVGILGFSSGILPACVVAASSSTLEYITNAVHTYRLAFWIGVRVLLHRSRILKERDLPDNCDLPWSRVFHGISKRMAEQAIESSQIKDGLICVTAVLNDACVTISGLPDCLDAFSKTLQRCPVDRTNMTTDALYHSTLNHQTRCLVLADIYRRQILFPDYPDIKVPIRTSLTGNIISRQTFSGTLVEIVLDMLLLQPVNWHLVSSKILEFRDVSLRLVNVGPGSGLVHDMVKALHRGKVSILDLMTNDVQNTHQMPFQQEPIAIIGMAVNMPGARNTSELWEILENNINTVAEIPEHRFKLSDYHDLENARSGRSMKTRTGNFIATIDEFDNEFFQISPREARSMDPQQRLLLHTAYEALEDAGYVPNATKSFQQATFGCYIGAATHDYAQNLKDDIDIYYNTGTLKAFLSGRISHAMRFCGPSIVVDTACSSSSVALYQGCRALIQGDCNAALVGGVNVITSPDMYLGLDRGHLLSPTGQCKPFDASADGYSRSEGCGLFVIKRLSDARAENDNILGVIRGIEVNQSGSANSIIHPHFATQKTLFETLLQKTGVDANHVNVVEAHGTGTQAGDTTEVASIRCVFGSQRTSSDPLYITSIKANIGHLEAASGAAGLAKLLLMLQHQTIPKQISLRRLNPDIAPLQSDHTIIPTAPIHWLPPQGGMTRMALLNNFGAAGSNSALLLEEYPLSAHKCIDNARTSYVFGMSAKTDKALKELRSRYLQWFRSSACSTACLADIAYTMTARRLVYPYRIAVSAVDRTELIEKLSRAPLTKSIGQPAKLAFVFSGQGGHYFGMGRTLYRTCPGFRLTIDHCHSILVELGFPGILRVINGESREEGSFIRRDFECQQVAIVALEYALAQLWMTWGLSPCVVVGHSIGEYSAMAIANVITIEAALALVADRARLVLLRCQLNYTGMLAVNADPVIVQEQLRSSLSFADLSVACFNGPTDCVVAGPLKQLRALKDYLDHVVHCRNTLLSVPFGFHSAGMRLLVDDFLQIAQRVEFSSPTIPIASTVTGEIVMPGDTSVFRADYFANHCLEPVLFEKAVNAVLTNNDFAIINAWIEIGPHATLLPVLRRNSLFSPEMLLISSLRKEQDSWLTLTNSLAQLYLLNVGVHWKGVFAHLPTVSCVKLPSYPFLKNKFWVPFKEESREVLDSIDPEAVGSITEYSMVHSWLQYPSGSNGNVAIFRTPISELADAIQGHKVGGLPLCPVSAYLEQVFGAIELVKRDASVMTDEPLHFRLSTVEFVNPLVYDPHIERSVETKITLDDVIESFTITSLIHSSAEKVVHVQGKLQSQSTYDTSAKFSRFLPTLIGQIFNLIEQHGREQLESFSTRTIYDIIFPRVVEYSEAYRTIQSIAVARAGTDAYAIAKLPVSHRKRQFVVNPVFMDTMFHVAGFVANLQGGANDIFICKEVDSVEVLSDIVDYETSFGVYCRASWIRDSGLMVAEVYAVQLALPWRIVAHLKGMQFRRVRLDSLKRGLTLAAGNTHRRNSGLSTPWSHQASQEASPEIFRNPGSELEAQVLRVISETCNINITLDLHMDLASLGIDSLLTIELIQRLRCLFPDADLRPYHFLPCRTVEDIVRYTSGSSFCFTTSLQACSAASSPRTLVHDDSIFEQNTPNFNHELDTKRIIASVLRINPADLCDNTNFDDLGMDSLGSIEALHLLQKDLGINLPRNLFTKCPTVGSVNAFLDRNRRDSEIARSVLPTKHQKIEDATLRAQEHIVPIHLCENPVGIPLLLIHDGSGLVNFYDRLPSLDRNLLAIRNPKVTKWDAWDDLNAMATSYANDISEMISGPLIVGGWSFGGVVAFEVARILLAKGVTVKGVLLIDSPSPINHSPLSDQLIDHIVNLGGRQACAEISMSLKYQFRTNSHLLARYNPFSSPWPSPLVVLLRSSEAFNPPDLHIPEWLSDRPDHERLVGDWETVVGESVKVLPIPGNHFQPFDPLHIADVALRIVEGCQYLETS